MKKVKKTHYSVAEAAKKLRRTRAYVYKMIQQKRIKYRIAEGNEGPRYEIAIEDCKLPKPLRMGRPPLRKKVS